MSDPTDLHLLVEMQRDRDEWERVATQRKERIEDLEAEGDLLSARAEVADCAHRSETRVVELYRTQLHAAESRLAAATALVAELRALLPIVERDRRPGSLFRRSGAFLSGSTPASAAWDIRGKEPVLVAAPAAESEPAPDPPVAKVLHMAELFAARIDELEADNAQLDERAANAEHIMGKAEESQHIAETRIAQAMAELERNDVSYAAQIRVALAILKGTRT